MQRFEFVDHANYQLKIKESLTLKPDGLTITIKPRSGRTWGASPRAVAAATNPRTPALAVAPADRHGTPLLVLFGSNLGASEEIASRIARDASDRGPDVRTRARLGARAPWRRARAWPWLRTRTWPWLRARSGSGPCPGR